MSVLLNKSNCLSRPYYCDYGYIWEELYYSVCGMWSPPQTDRQTGLLSLPKSDICIFAGLIISALGWWERIEKKRN